MKRIKNRIRIALALMVMLTGSAPAIAGKPMPVVQVWEGPFKSTQILKLADYAEGVVCYVYSPNSVSWRWGDSGDQRFDGNSAGAISCVKVGNATTTKRK